MGEDLDGSTWQEISSALEARILAGEFAPGERLPSGDQFALQAGLGRSAVHRAIEDLQRRGLVVRRRGSGTVVAERPAAGLKRVALLADRFAPHLNYPSGDLIQGLKEGLGEEIRLVVEHSADDLESEARQFQNLAEEMDGLVVYPIARNELQALYGRLGARGYPLVALNRRHIGVECDAVFMEDRAAVRHAVGELLARGHRRIGFLSNLRPNFQSTAERFEGFRDALTGVGHERWEEDVRWMPPGSAVMTEGVHQVVHDTLFALTRRQDPITALLCTEDGLTASALRAGAELGLRVPRDLEIVAVSDWPLESLLTAGNVDRIVPRKREMGAAAARLLLARHAEPKRPYETVRVPADFVPAR